MAKQVPASIRYKNPGAMWGSALAVKWGASPRAVSLNDGTGQGNTIAVFPTYVQGICAQLDLWRTSRHYRNKKFSAAIAIWSGGNHVESYIKFVLDRVPGMTRDAVLNDAFWQSDKGIAFLKAQAWHEAGRPYPAPDDDWIEARRRVFAADAPKVEVKSKVITTARAAGGAAATVAAGAQIAGAIVEPVSETVTQVRAVTDDAGQVIATTKEIVQVVPETWTAHLLAFAKSPAFLVSIIVIMALTWLVTWYLRRREG